MILKKVLLSVPTSIPTNHTVIYEYKATKAVSCIEYQVENILEEVGTYLIVENYKMFVTIMIYFITGKGNS